MGIYYINRLINIGPEDRVIASEDGVPTRPLSAAGDAARDASRKGS
jgi:cytochrome d ubiquinol oxidase subunit I